MYNSKENLKPIEWMGDSLERLRLFPNAARQRAGFELQMVQAGFDPTDWKPMRSAGSGVREIRIHMEGEYRVLYVAKFERAVYVLHAFAKKRQTTPKQAIDLAKIRYREVLRIESRP